MYRTYLQKVGTKEFYTAEWDGSDATLVGIHGLTGNHGHFLSLAQALSPQFRFIAYDVRGRGDSSPADSPSSIAKHAEDAIAFIESLHVDFPVLIGHSMGAFISAIVASRYRNLAGIVLLDGAGVITDNEVQKLTPALGRLSESFSSVEDYIDIVKPLYAGMGLDWNATIDASVRHEINTEGKKCMFKGERDRILEDLGSALHQFPHEQVFPQIHCPVLLVSATGAMGDEPLYPESAYDKTIQHTPNLRYHAAPDNHYTLLLSEKPSVADLIREFVEECSP